MHLAKEVKYFSISSSNRDWNTPKTDSALFMAELYQHHSFITMDFPLIKIRDAKQSQITFTNNASDTQ